MKNIWRDGLPPLQEIQLLIIFVHGQKGLKERRKKISMIWKQYRWTSVEKRNLPADDAFKKSILHFCKCIEDSDTRKANYETLLRQARLVEDFKRLANIDVNKV